MIGCALPFIAPRFYLPLPLPSTHRTMWVPPVPGSPLTGLRLWGGDPSHLGTREESSPGGQIPTQPPLAPLLPPCPCSSSPSRRNSAARAPESLSAPSRSQSSEPTPLETKAPARATH